MMIFCIISNTHPSQPSMTNRSAHATIKGYFYQFDHTIVRILAASSHAASVTVEGIEDIDLSDGDEGILIQCKYYEGSEYNHSIVKDAVMHMLRHYHKGGCNPAQTLRYRLYGHYACGQDKLPADFDVAFMKKHFLSYKAEGVLHELHAELSIDDGQLAGFRHLLEIDLRASSYDKQQAEALRLIQANVPGSRHEDTEAFYYPNAIHAVQCLAVEADEARRKISKAEFLASVNRKEAVFSLWLRKKFGDDYYARLVKRKHFTFPGTKVPNAARIFALDATAEFDLGSLTQALMRIGKRYSHVEHRNTNAADRFCPYVMVSGLSVPELVSLKENLVLQGTELCDGHAFDGAKFSAKRLARVPVKDSPTKLKFIATPQQLAPLVSSISGVPVELFDFFKSAPLDGAHIPAGIPHHRIPTDTIYIINEAT